MSERVYQLSSDKEVQSPACLVVVDANNQPFENSLIVLSKAKSLVPIKYPNRVERMVVVELDSSEMWWLQEVMIIKGEIHARPTTERIQLQDGSVSLLSSGKRLFFCANLLKCVPLPSTIIPSSEPFESALKSLDEEVTCSICLGMFNVPLTLIHCGHTFCNDCLHQWWASGGRQLCPMCQQRITSSIRVLALDNLVKTTKALKKAIKRLPSAVPDPPVEVITIHDDTNNFSNFVDEVITID